MDATHATATIGSFARRMEPGGGAMNNAFAVQCGLMSGLSWMIKALGTLDVSNSAHDCYGISYLALVVYVFLPES